MFIRSHNAVPITFAAAFVITLILCNLNFKYEQDCKFIKSKKELLKIPLTLTMSKIKHFYDSFLFVVERVIALLYFAKVL